MVNNSRRSREAARPFVVKGEIRGKDASPAASLLVKAFDADMRVEELLGEATTDERGTYQITYTAEQFSHDDNDRADLIVRVFDSEGSELGASEVMYNAPAEATIDLVVEPLPNTESSEYEQLLADIMPLLEGVALADLTDDNIAFLAAKTGVERKRLEYLRHAAQLSRQTDLPIEVFYAFARHDLPLDLKSLLSSDLDTLRGVLETAIKRRIIPAGLLSSLPEIVARLAEMKSDHTPVSELAADSGIELPSALRSFLDERGIHTLADIRARGGIARIEGLPVSQDDAAVETLDAQARLSVLPGDPSMNARLVNAGYKSLGDIAGTPRQTFVDVFKDQLRPDVATIIHTAATMQASSLNNLLTDLDVRRLNGSLEEETGALLEDVCPQVCGCKDCENATSPLAYLADLLDYTVRHLKQNGNAVTLTSLEKSFHQPFRDLPAKCELMDQQVHQVRICIEVLRQYLPAQYANSTPQWYLETAYRLLLERHGTSFDEIRRARNAHHAERIKLAERLGFALKPSRSLPTDPDVLDFLLLDIDPNAPASQPWPVRLSEESLEQLFGLRDTNRPPLADPVNVPVLLYWRMRYLRNRWLREDWVDTPPSFAAPFIDPDIVGADDINDTVASKLRDDRSLLLQITEDEMKQFIKQPGFDLLLQDRDATGHPLGGIGLGQSIADLVALRDKRDKNKHDITGDLQNLQLSEEAFDYLVFVAELYEQPSPILSQEWDNVTAILLQRWKQNNKYTDWRNEEQTAQITLSPDYFRLRSGTPFGRNSQWQPKPWRSSSEVRQKWENILRTRIEQEQAVKDHIEAATNAVEEALLVELRNELLRTAFLPGVLTTEKLRELTHHLQIDLQADICQMTTRVAQAIETIQGLLFGTRNGLLDTESFTLDAPNFDEEWKWLGSYATWRAAMQVFLYPENALRPSLRRRSTPAFQMLVENLRNSGRIDPEIARKEADKYEGYFRDICSLRFAGLCQTQGFLDSVAGRPVSGVYETGDVLAVGRGGASGNFYLSSWKRNPGWGLRGSPNQTPWEAVSKLQSNSEIFGILPYQTASGKVQVGLYFQARKEDSYSYQFVFHNGTKASEAMQLPELPSLLCTAQYANGFVPTSPVLTAKKASPWSLQPDDQLVAVDLDGDGRSEIVVFAARPDANGQRRVGLLREYGGGLVLDQEGLISQGWQVPDADCPVVFDTQTNTSPWPLKRLLIVNPTGPGGAQVATFGLVNGSLEMMNAASTITGPAGSWSVNLGTSTTPTSFISANVDGSGRMLLVFEHMEGQTNGSVYTTTNTTVNVFDWGNNRFVFSRSPQMLNHTVDADPGYSVKDVKWERFIPVRRGFPLPESNDQTGFKAHDDILVYAEHTVYHTSPKKETRPWIALLRWDNAAGRFLDPPTVLYWGNALQEEYVGGSDDVPAVAGQQPWTLQSDDRFFALDVNNKDSQAILVQSPSRSLVGVLTYAKDGRLQVAWQSDHIEREDGSGQKWRLDADDQLFPADTNGDGADEILIVRPTAGNAAVLTVQSGQSLAMRWVAPGTRIQAPGETGWPGWLVKSKARYFSSDINDDGNREFIALTNDGGVRRLGVLQAIQDPTPLYLLGHEALPVQFGPIGVTALDIREQFSESLRLERKQQIKSAYQANVLYDGMGNPVRDLGGNLIYIDQQVRYLDEAYYFVPMELALRMRENGYYTEALDWLRSLYDYERPISDRKIAYKLVLDEQSATNFDRYANWLGDPLNPHAIAETRKNGYTRFTILAIVRCLLDFADAEFTRATSESVARARALYEEALELLDLPEIKQHLNACADKIAEITIQVGEEELPDVLNKIKQHLFQIRNYKQLATVVNRVKAALGSEASLADRLAAAQKIVLEVQPDTSPTLTYGMLLEQNAATRKRAEVALLAEPKTERFLLELGKAAAGAHRPESYSGTLSATDTSYRGAIILDPNLPLKRWGQYIPAPILCFCVPPNPAIQTAHIHVEANLHKIRTCRNIAGMQMRLDPYALPTLAEAGLQSLGSGDGLPALQPPTLLPLPYRYATLIERAKQLVQLAQQIEASMLASLQSKDHEEYELLKARQDLELAQAGQRLKELQVVEATDGITLAALQRDRAKIQGNHYKALIAAGPTLNEHLAVGFLYATAALYQTSAALKALANWSVEGIIKDITTFTGAVTPVLDTQAQATSALSQVFSTYANYERREQEWQLSSQVADQDVRIGEQQILQAQDHVQVANQDRTIAALQVEHAGAMVDFIANKFTNPDLYDWMSNVLEQVYRFFLNEATSIAKLAEMQLAFERQEIPPAYIQADYWEPPSTNPPPASIQSDGAGQTTNVRGLTGAERLLQDIYQLDQYAFKRNQRKLQLSKTISLAQLDPFAFQRFRESGVLNFATPMNLFDRDFPGHYFRLVRRVRTSVIALIPPTQSIRAMLSTTGASRVIIGPAPFQRVVIQRGPESVALTSPINATGVFELDQQAELLGPFEGIGVDATWELRMPRPANLFDYNTIADVLITIEYTAFNSYDYQQQMLERLRQDQRMSADRAFSFRTEFSDAWYDLHNPELVEDEQKQMVVTFKTERADFPPNLEENSITVKQIVLYFAHASKKPFKQIQIAHLQFKQDGNTDSVQTDAEGVISTRTMTPPQSWETAILGQRPFGEWELSFNYGNQTDDKTIRDRFKDEKDEKIEDILFIITYEGNTPEWPA